MMDEIIKLVLSFLLGVGLCFLLIGGKKEVEPELITDTKEKARADSLSTVLDSLIKNYKEQEFVLEEIKTNHRDEINSISGLSTHDIYLLWTGGQRYDSTRESGTAGGLYK